MIGQAEVGIDWIDHRGGLIGCDEEGLIGNDEGARIGEAET